MLHITIYICFIGSALRRRYSRIHSFQLFLDLQSGDSLPDETTICRYRELFSQLRLDNKLFKSFKKQLRKRGLLIEQGTLVDATLKQAYTRAIPHNNHNNRDKDADFTKRGQRTYFSYKGHVGIDSKTKVIHSVEFTKASVHDTDVFDELLTGREQIVFADKGNANQKRKTRLRQKGVCHAILEKGYRALPLSNKQV